MSSAIDEDTLRTIDGGREALGEMLSAVQKRLQYIFVFFVIGLMGTIYFLQEFGWDKLKHDLLSGTKVEVIGMTPFEVILLQVKIGLVVGFIIALPSIIYFSRDALRERGWWPTEKVPRWKIAIISVLSLVLMVLGVAYGYFLFFPIMFDFLSTNSIQAGIAPNYSIAKWAQFVFLLTISFGLAAQLPLVMSGLGYAGIVRYETFREKWRYAVVFIFVFGALFSPPDPFTQIMWAVPLLFLYVFSLGLTRFVVSVKQSNEQIGFARIAIENWTTILGSALLSGLLAYEFVALGYGIRTNEALQRLSSDVPAIPRIESVLGLAREPSMIVVGVVVALVAAFAVFVVHLFRALNELAASSYPTPSPASAGDPSEIDLSRLDAESIAVAPTEVFADMTEDEALTHASTAMDAGHHEKARAILDRFDSAHAAADATPVEAGASASAANDAASPDQTSDAADTASESEPDEEGDVLTRTTAGVVNAFTDDETTGDDIGGYFYDIQFIIGSLSSRMFRLVAVFMLVMGGVFGALYMGVLRILKEDFLRRLPDSISPGETVGVVGTHPVEHLIFEVKISVIIGAVATVPLLLYYAWPALKDRGFVSGNRGVLFTWATATIATITIGSILGYAFVAPYIISWLAWDVINSGMLIKYRISSFGWLVFFTTVGIGLLASVPMTMILFHRGGIAPYTMLRRRWREAVVAILIAASMLSPSDMFTMLLFAIPLVFAYLFGLAVLWVYTLGGRRPPKGSSRRTV